MSKLSDAADALLVWAGTMQGVFLVADELKALGSLEQARQERQDAADKAQTDLANVRQQLSNTQAQLQAAEDKAKEISAQAAASAQALVSSARQEAENIIQKARSDAASIANAAAADEEVAQRDAKAELDRVTGLTNEKRAELAAINEQIKASAAEHDRLSTAMQTMRENAKAIAG